MPKLVARIAPTLILVLLPILASWPAFVGFSADPIYLMSGLLNGGHPGLVPGSPAADLDVGVTTQALGHLAAEQWLHGQVPWWNPYSGIGMPLAGEMQASALFLPFVLLLHFQSGTLLLKLAMQILAGLFCHRLLLRLELGRIAALAGAMLFALNGSFAWLGHGPIMPIAFLPLLLLGIEHARQGGFRLVAMGVALSLYAGFPETAYLDGLLALLWAGSRVAGAARPGWVAGRILLGGLLGLGLACPAIWSFAHMLLHGTTGNHALPLSIFATLPDSAPRALSASWLFPYLTGPLAAYTDAAGEASRTAAYQGGYLGTLPLLLAAIGLFGARLRVLRLVLAGWIVFVIGGVSGVPGFDFVLYALPLLRQVIVARYAVPSCCLAAIVLAAMAVSDWRGGLNPRPLALALFAAIAAASLSAAWPLVTALRFAHGWTAASLLWAGAGVAFALVLICRPPTPRAALLLAALLAFDAAAGFAIPLLAGPRDATIDLAAVRFLADHTGLQRFYSMGPYRPNYGAFFQTAQINHEYLPLPANWVSHLHTALDPAASVIMFRGDEPPDLAAHQAALRQNRAAFAALAVRYVVTPPGQDPFATGFDLVVEPGPGAARVLPPDGALSGEAIAEMGPIAAVGVDIATYVGASDGALVVDLCAGSVCTSGSVALADAADNAQAMVRLSPPLDVHRGEALRWRIRHDGGSHAVLVRLHRLSFAGPSSTAPRVYADATMEIHELPEAAAYFDAGPGCRLEIADRTHLQADCTAPAKLIRRELLFSGWRAWVNGAAATIAPGGEVMQAIEVPAGRSDIRFAYAPPGVWVCWVIAGIALLCMVPFRWQVFAVWSRSA